MTYLDQLNLLGLAKKANKLVSGTDLVMAAMKNGTAKQVLLARESSERTQREFKLTSEKHQIPLSLEFTEWDLSQAIGQHRRVVAIVDNGLAKSFRNKEEK